MISAKVNVAPRDGVRRLNHEAPKRVPSHLLFRIFALVYTYIPNIKHSEQLALLNTQVSNIVKTTFDDKRTSKK